MEQVREQERLVGDLTLLFPRFPRATLERLVRRVYAEYADARVQDYVPVLVRRDVLTQLRYADPAPARRETVTSRR